MVNNYFSKKPKDSNAIYDVVDKVPPIKERVNDDESISEYMPYLFRGYVGQRGWRDAFSGRLEELECRYDSPDHSLRLIGRAKSDFRKSGNRFSVRNRDKQKNDYLLVATNTPSQFFGGGASRNTAMRVA